MSIGPRIAALILSALGCLFIGSGVSFAQASGPAKRPPGSVAPVQAAGVIVTALDGGLAGLSGSQSQVWPGDSAGGADLTLRYVRATGGGRHVFHFGRPVPYDEAMRAARRLQAQDARILHAEPDVVLSRRLIPNDSGFDLYQWNLKAPNTSDGNRGGANLPLAWDIARGAGVVVAVLDSGTVSHPDLAGVMIGGYDFISDATRARDGDGRDASPADEGDWGEVGECDTAGGGKNTAFRKSTWHGAFVTGVIAANTNNSRDLAGVAFESKILPVRVLGRCGEGLLSDVADAIRWAAGGTVPGVPANSNPARVVNLSLGASASCSPTMQAAVDEARARGAVVVAATGNEGAVGIGMPANCSGVLAVTAHNFQGDNADYASVGPGTGISAPGGGNCSTPDGNGFTCLTKSPSLQIFHVTSLGLWGARSPNSTDTLQVPPQSGPVRIGYVGTSAAAPHVAGAAALLLSQNAQLTERQVRGLLQRATRPFPPGTLCAALPEGIPAGSCGTGMLDPHAALLLAADQQPLAASVLPASRSVTVGGTATVFATIVNGGTKAAQGCAIAPKTAGLGAFSFRATDPATNALIGAPNEPIDIPAGQFRSFVIAFTPSAPVLPTEVELRFDCFNAAPVGTLSGINTLLVSASAAPVSDLIALAATVGNTGIVSVPAVGATGAFAVATANVGAAGTITASVDTAATSLPINLSICQTNPSTGACTSSPGASVSTTVAAGATPTFAVFAAATGPIPLNPAAHRVYVRFRDGSGAVRGATSVAIRTM